jgi:lipid A ethanolaminephosphotransferase
VVKSLLSAPSHPRRPLGLEWLLFGVSLLWLPVANHRFLAVALEGRPPGAGATWTLAAALVVALVAIHYLLLAALAWGRLAKPVVIVMLLVAALASHYVRDFGVYLDPAMLRNALRSDVREASEVIGWRLGLSILLLAALPAAWLWRQPLARRPWRRALAIRLGTMALALLALLAGVLVAFQPLASLMRNQRELRYLITPANAVYSLASVARRESAVAGTPRLPVGRDAVLGPTFAARKRPAVVVLVVGETARAANWGLNGYARNTTPQLAALRATAGDRFVNFPDVTSCDTDTETSLPCMFATIGRRDYNERRIRSSENLLHLLATAGVGVQWRDNQSGCKGVCDGFPNTTVATLAPPGLCSGDHCLDEGLLHGLVDDLAAKSGPQLVVLHQLGNHGPAYYRRVPPAFERFTPVCRHNDLQRCTREEIVNAYDNALLYTDHLLAQLIGQLHARADVMDSAVIYVSDHGESLGEHRLFLHGMPWAIAPEVQKKVPMVMWLGAGFAAARGIDGDCLAQRAGQPVQHDHLAHTVLGLLDVQTGAREPGFDLVGACTRQP